jgi:nicotinate-nucleotide adenylyltransferase
MRPTPGIGRVGILGGTLDPIHIGHVEAALAAQKALSLNAVIIMPARVPPHRQEIPSASTFHRFAMAALAVIDLENVTVSDEELCSDGPSYTALTLERLISHGLDPRQIFFITGADAFAEIATWYRYPAVLELAHFVVISRPGMPVAMLGERLPELRHRLREAARTAPMPAVPSVFLVDAATPDVSSTEIRRRLRAGESIRGMVPLAVERHIARHRLYAETATAEHVQ